MRARPRRSAARRALRDAARQARECLPLSVERAEVAGSFAGSTGRYSVESVLGENIGREQRDCIRAAFEGARVLPFRTERYEMAEVVSRTEPANASEGSTEPAVASGGQAEPTNSTATTTAANTSAGGAGAGTASAGTTSAGTASNASTTVAGSAGSAGSATATNSSGVANSSAGSAVASTATATTTTTTATTTTTTATASPTGTIENTAVANIMRTRTNVVRTCYQNQLARDPSLRARVRVRFTIDAAGLVTQASSTAVAEVGDPDRVSDLARCLEGIVRGTTFPARVGASPAEVSMPFVFSPGAPSTTVATASSTGSAANGGIATPGTLDRERVATTIRARMPSLSQCYQRAAQQDPQLAGRVTVRFVVNPDGRVADVQSTPTSQAGTPAHMNDVARCVQSAFFSFVFYPPTGGAAAAVLPLDFGPSS